MIIRAKRKDLFDGKQLTEKQIANSRLNMQELNTGEIILNSLPRRLVFELTNLCNLNCIMCGRNASDFKPTIFDMNWFRYFEKCFDVVEEVTLMGWGEPTMHPDFTEMLRVLDQHSARKYFCTNGMFLGKIAMDIFNYHVDVFAVSIDGALPETNDSIRRGSNLKGIFTNLSQIIKYKKDNHLNYPWINFVFCAMRSNLHELPDLVRIASDIGVDEVKVVYLTAFDDSLSGEILYDCQDEVRAVFDEASSLGEKLGVLIKLPYIQGEDIAESNSHKDCYVVWRDFFLGSDGFIRPCMSTCSQFDVFDINKSFYDMWNSERFQEYRKTVNSESLMDYPCKRCYQSSFCNWNKKDSFLQKNYNFAPQWKK